MIKGEIEIRKTARYFLSAESKGKFSKVCFALHGYGQLASFFCKKLENKALQDTLFICPEGLHRFYLKDSSGRVGSSWMTKEDRESEIEDYISYLNQIYRMIKDLNPEVKIIAFGFSQGSSTISRWIAQDNPDIICDRLILWSGSFPMDVIEVMKKHDNICNYLDMPLQHGSSKVLKAMRRGIDREKTSNTLWVLCTCRPSWHWYNTWG